MIRLYRKGVWPCGAVRKGVVTGCRREGVGWDGVGVCCVDVQRGVSVGLAQG